MGIFDPRTHSARAYFVRSGRMFMIAGAVVAIVTALAAPDTFGRVFGAGAAVLLIVRGALRFKKAGEVSAEATVEESLQGRQVAYTLHDPKSR
jgi:hypothetical protein